MKTARVPFSDTGLFPALLTRYLSGDESLKPFYRFKPELQSFTMAIAERRKTKINRQVLHDALLRQYERLIEPAHEAKTSIESLLSEDTFTITTGHQLNIFTGPLYCVYKVLSTIRLAQQLRDAHPECNFVPVFWMASEDHDIAEIDHFRVYGNELKWEQAGVGPSGRLSTAGLEDLSNRLQELLGEQHQSIGGVFKNAYSHHHNLADATREIFNTLFGKFGLVVLDGDDSVLKREFAPMMLQELTAQTSFSALSETNTRFQSVGKLQVAPRNINLFYLQDGLRERIDRAENGDWTVLNTSLVFNQAQLENELNHHPERFSPNVVLRPVYQETILPNLAYIGGPGELNYWLQLKDVFSAFDVFYPMVLMRSSFTLLNDADVSRMEKLGFAVTDLFQSQDSLLVKALERIGETAPDLSGAYQQAGDAFEMLKQQLFKVDATLVPSVEAEKAKAMKAISNLEEKAHRAVKRKNEQMLAQITKLKSRIAPSGVPQERIEGFPGLNADFSGKLIDELLPHASPIEPCHTVVM
ncbi:MAG: bacillithiol biosynthesis cysteine-adding enzyme BshC [Bacteroidota bacterium]